VIDESHMTVPQIRGMYNGDRSRKQTLIDYGFRLPAAADNRPLRFDEFLRRIPQTIYVSATPNEWEMSRGRVVEQLVRPTGLVDPTVSVRPSSGQIDDLLHEIESRVTGGQRVLVTTLTKRMAEDLATFLKDRGIKVHYLHSDIVTLERTDILADLRAGTYDVVVGINLLREGLDLPEVSLVAILDADKEGFLRSRTSLIQTMGRAARHVAGEVIMYADVTTDSMKAAISEVTRRRSVQLNYNTKHGITPKSIQKPIRKKLVEETKEEEEAVITPQYLEKLTPMDRENRIVKLTKQMRQASRDLDFEQAVKLRDLIGTLR
ncbi:MAG: helicase-related protein, partial [Patescibacteria group bacterium]